MQTLEIKVYELFKTRFSEAEATSIIEYIEAKAEKKYEEKKDVLATKADINEVRLEIREVKTDILRQMYITNIIQLLAIVGSVVAIIKYMVK